MGMKRLGSHLLGMFAALGGALYPELTVDVVTRYYSPTRLTAKPGPTHVGFGDLVVGVLIPIGLQPAADSLLTTRDFLRGQYDSATADLRARMLALMVSGALEGTGPTPFDLGVRRQPHDLDLYLGPRDSDGCARTTFDLPIYEQGPDGDDGIRRSTDH